MLRKYSGALLIGGVCAAVMGVAQQAGAADSYPARPVRMVVPFAPGGSDIVARMLAPKFSERLGQSFVVENRPGAASVVGTEIVAKSQPDGYTLLFCTASLATTAAFMKKLPYDPVQDLAGIGQVGWVPFVLVTHPALPVKSVKEFIALAKKRPGDLFYSSPGVGGIGHLVNEYFNKKVGIKTTHVAYKGSGPSITALLVGEVQFGMFNSSAVLSFVRSEKVRPLGVAAEARISYAPDLPTLRELGVDLVGGPWYGMVAPRGTPQQVIDLLNRELGVIVKMPDIAEKLAGRGLIVQTRTPKDFENFIRSDIGQWQDVMRTAGLKQE